MINLVVTGDLIASRAFGAGTAAQLLDNVVRETNGKFTGTLAVPLRVIRGDGFQGVVKADSAMKMVFFLQAWLVIRSNGRLKSRFGMGFGAIDQSLDAASDPALLTGPAFVSAATALEAARKEKRQLMLQGPDPRLTAAANGAFGLVEFVWNRWSPEVWRRAQRYDELEAVKPLAAELGVSYQAVHKQLHQRGVLAVREALVGLGELLEREGNRDHVP
ncbi:SatD family protein [Oceanithermus sp.]|uniref:SatD family protein n=1 Tax=Oceanithermus sp. TaxID=2268145 RepID=UPI00257D00E7|nr:SatD family protein [Oceanithermus sp.]